jgi:hypothetical protein
MAASLANALAQRVGGVSPRLADRIRRRVDVSTAPGRFSGVTAALGDVVGEVRRRSPRARILLVDYLTVVGSHEHGGELAAGVHCREASSSTSIGADGVWRPRRQFRFGGSAAR